MKLVAKVLDDSRVTLYKVPDTLYNEILTKYDLQQLYDSNCNDDPIAFGLYKLLCECEIIDCDYFTEY